MATRGTGPAVPGERKRILTGVRPSGPAHVGHYAGALVHWARLQHEYESFFLLADYQVSDYADNIELVRWAVWEFTLDWLAVGLDPDIAHFVIESGVPEFAELTLHLSWFLGIGHLQRNPTLKAEMEKLEGKSLPVAFLTYPVMQMANILMPKAHLVPVGEDQLPHIEMTRDVAQRFNTRFGEVFVLPEGWVGDVPRLVGVDGKAKMSKSLDNAIYLKDDEATLRQKVRGMYTDPTRLRATDPGHVDGNPVFMYHDAFNPDRAEVDDLKARYVAGKVGDVEVKDKLFRAMNALLAPMRERRASWQKRPNDVRDVLAAGTAEMKRRAEALMEDVRAALRLNYLRDGPPPPLGAA
ncbi:MAG: tryptophan--tRNA ligase [Actinobacteria bacterium]|nr:tryptophan--tRNA ligase [Actinomycetota bacterium]